jgi:hypothetical protein
MGGKSELTFKLFPTICFSTRYSSPFEIYPSRSISYTLNATAPVLVSLPYHLLYPISQGQSRWERT